jgi:hypothetical protein
MLRTCRLGMPHQHTPLPSLPTPSSQMKGFPPEIISKMTPYLGRHTIQTMIIHLSKPRHRSLGLIRPQLWRSHWSSGHLSSSGRQVRKIDESQCRLDNANSEFRTDPIGRGIFCVVGRGRGGALSAAAQAEGVGRINQKCQFCSISKDR